MQAYIFSLPVKKTMVFDRGNSSLRVIKEKAWISCPQQGRVFFPINLNVEKKRNRAIIF